MEFSRPFKGQQISAQILALVVGMLALSTLLIGAFFWGYIARKYKKDRRTSPACPCVDSEQSAGCQPRKSGGEMIDSIANVEKTASQQPRTIQTIVRSEHSEFHITEAEEGCTQVLTDARKGKSTKPSKSAAIDVKCMPFTNGLASPFYSAAIDLKSMPFSNGLASPFYYNRSGHDEVDLDYLAYEFQVAQAQLQYHERNVAHGGWHAWKSLKFWKRIPKENGMRPYGGSAAPTPIHPTYITATYQPSTPGPTHYRSRHGTWGPLYSDDVSKLPAHYRSKRSCSSPITNMKVIMPHKDDCNMSPYVPLNRAQQLASGPLYLV